MEKKYFSVEEANQLLPLVKTELAYLQELKKQFYQKYHELQSTKKRLGYGAKTDTALKDTVFTLECQLDFLDIEARMRLKSMLDKGIQIKDIDIGLVDFPALRDGEEILLCWKQGEDQIAHYHGENDGFAGRKPLQ